MNRGAGHQPTFLDDGDRMTFLYLLETMSERHPIEVHSYCLMGNHYHLLAQCPEGELSDALKYLSSVYTRRFNRKHQTDGALFRGRFLSKAIETEEYLAAVVRYIPRNPLAFLKPSELETYPWSSHLSYADLASTPHWLKTKVVLDMFNGRIGDYASFVTGDRTPVSDATILAELRSDTFSGR